MGLVFFYRLIINLNIMPLGDKLKAFCMGECTKGRKTHQIIGECSGITFKIPNDIVDDWIGKHIYDESLDYSDEIDIKSSDYISDGSPLQDDKSITLYYQIIQCGGCDYISFRKAYSIDENINNFEDEEDNEQMLLKIEMIDRKFYPERRENLWYPIVIPSRVSVKLKMMYQNSIKAYNRDLFILSSVGFRAVIEGICKYLLQEHNITIRGRPSLMTVITKLHNEKIIDDYLFKILDGSKLIGNKAIHQINIPTNEELNKLREAVEYFIRETFEKRDLADKF